MQPRAFDELAFFQAIGASGARALLLGRRALVLLGLPVLTADYDFWIAIDDIARFNGAAELFGLTPNHDPAQAKRRGRFVLENSEHVDVIVARAVPTADGENVEFETIWSRRQTLTLAADVAVQLPSIDDLILTKRFSTRPRDLEDIRLLRILKDGGA